MTREKKPVHRVQMTEGKRNIIHQLLEKYDIQTAEDIQDALKDLLGGTIKEMMEAEMDGHLGYEKSERSDSDDSRNGCKWKRVNSRYGSMEIEVPQMILSFTSDEESPKGLFKRQSHNKIIVSGTEVESYYCSKCKSIITITKED